MLARSHMLTFPSLQAVKKPACKQLIIIPPQICAEPELTFYSTHSGLFVPLSDTGVQM